ncbi:MAG: hypothetical protein ABI549_02990 [Flavobacterium sp.]|uniref:hypothetical protein n=1 Tax=Flavobacterium sp. TaxID=239 RepID=UPI003262E4B4
MIRILFLAFPVFLLSQSVFCQTLLKGKVVFDDSNLDEIYVTNLSTNAKTITDSSGLFSIEAKPNQVLVFSGPKLERKVLNLKPIDFSTNLLYIKLYPKATQLEEVVIKNYPQINAVSLGIISKDVKTYTPAERRLISESSGIGIVQFINAINGRKKELKKNIEVEKKEQLLDKLSRLFEDDFYIKTLKISSEYIKGFQIFAIDDNKLITSLNKKNTKLTSFLLRELSLKYNDLLRNEKK